MRSARINAHLVPATIFILLLLFPSSNECVAQQPQTRKQEIYNLLSAHRFQQAEQAATTYLVGNPGDCTVNVLLGLALRGENKLEPAFNAFRSAMNDCPRSLAAIEGAAETGFILNKPEAKSLVTQVTRLRPTDETGYAMLGAIDARSGDCRGSVQNYAKAPSLVSINAPALKQYGTCLISLGQPAAAVPLLAHLLTLQDSSANRIALAYAQASAKDRDAGLATLQPLLGEDAHDSAAFLLAAQIAESGNDTPKAVAWFRKAIEIDPQNVTAYLNFAVVCFNHGAFKVGVDFMNIGILQLPSEARLYLARGVLEEQMTQMDAALQDFQEAHRLDPHLSFAEDAMGMLFSQKHDNAAALALFAQQSQLHPNDALLQYLYAEALSQATNKDDRLPETALNAAKRAVQLDPAYQPARDLLCVLLLRLNNFEDVVTQAQAAIKIDPYDEVAIYQELLAEHKLNHPDKTAVLVRQLNQAKAHNQQSRTKYLLEEVPLPASPSN